MSWSLVAGVAVGLLPTASHAAPPLTRPWAQQAKEPGRQPAVERAGPLASDVDSLLTWIDRIHPAPYRLHPVAVFDSAAADLRGRIDRLPAAQVPLELQRILALLGDGHSELATLPPSLRGPGLPLVIRRFQEGWFVTTGHTDYAALFARPIVSIGGVPVPELASRLAPYLAADNPIDRLDATGNMLRNARVLGFLGVPAAAGDEVGFEVVEPDGSRRAVPVKVLPTIRLGPEGIDVEKYLNPDVPEPLFRALDGNYACRYLPHERTIYVLFGEVRDDEELPPIDEFFPQALTFAESSEAERLVLDIRENSGGNLDLDAPIIRSIIRSRFDRPGGLFVITYTLTVTDDQVGICEASGTTSFSSSGDLSGTSSQVTFEPGTADEVTFTYTIPAR